MPKGLPLPGSIGDTPYTPGPIGPDGQPLDPNYWGNLSPLSGAVSPGGPSAGSTDPTGGAPDDFDLNTVEGIDQAIAQLQGQIAQSQQGGQAPDYSSFYKSPGYEFRLQEGISALDKSAAAKGKLFSGGYGRELTRYGQGLATSEFGNYANRLSSLAGIGQTATQYGGQLGAQAGGQIGQSAANIGQSLMAGGTAQASGIVGASNAWQQGIGGALGSVGGAVNQLGAQQGWWGGYDPSTGINWNTGRF